MPEASSTTSTKKFFSFKVNHEDGKARRGVISTARGDIQTPAFMPVGTAGTVKAMFTEDVKEVGADILLGNTYHLMLRPGAEEVAALGGLHEFMRWPYPILTDSGGFQVMSLAKLRKLTEDGVEFQSHLDGRKFMLTPERSIEIQCLLGADIQMQFDECIKLPNTRDEIERAMELSLRWGERSLKAFGTRPDQALFGIVQGGDVTECREKSALALKDMPFDGYAIGGLAVGEPQEVMLEMLKATIPYLPQDKPHYLMGVGTPDDLLKSIACGVDMFDCVMPTRAGRHGHAFTRYGVVNIKNARHRADSRPLDEQGPCEEARLFSRAYLHHLIKAKEYLGAMLLTKINLAYYQTLMRDARQAIEENRLNDFVTQTQKGWREGDIAPLS